MPKGRNTAHDPRRGVSRAILTRGDTKEYYENGRRVPGPFTIDRPAAPEGPRNDLMSQWHDRSTTPQQAAATWRPEPDWDDD